MKSNITFRNNGPMRSSLVRGMGGGGKGGGGEARAPVEAPDSLRSRQFARVLDLVSEGEIVGLVNGLQSIYLDDTPLQNADGTFNFTGVTVAGNPGTQSQEHIPGSDVIESETQVNAEVKVSTSVTRQVSNSNIDRVRVTLAIPQLTTQDTTTGDLSGTSVSIAIDLQANGGGFVAQALYDSGVISGKTTTLYQREYEIELTGDAPWDIRVRRLTADSGSVSLVNKTFWSSYTEQIDAKLTYPNSAVIGTEVDSAQFSSIPKRAYDLKGLIVRVPSNYDPVTRIYTGVWNGTYQNAWTDNPAWHYFELLTNKRFGVGNYISEDYIDKWALYAIGVYCDELVPDGFGGMEPRYTCNLYLQTREEAIKVLINLASIFRGMAYWAAGSITTIADMPSDAVALFTAANVVGGVFKYQSSGKNTRHTVVMVIWNDPEDTYRQKPEYVEDAIGIARYGVVPTEFVAFGTTSRGQAHRAGKWLLYTERAETELATFKTGLEGVYANPGEVIKTADPRKAGIRYGGRFVALAGDTVTLDAEIELEVGETYNLQAALPNGTIEERAVITGPSTTAVLQLASAFTSDPQVHAIWLLRSTVLVPETRRVLAVTESDGLEMEFIAISHNPNKYAEIEQGIILESPPTSILTSEVEPVTNLQATDSLFELSPGIVGTRIVLSWSGTQGRYRISYRRGNQNPITLPETKSQTIDIDNTEPGLYTFGVVQLNVIGKASATSSLTKEIHGKTTLPESPTGMHVQPYGASAHVSLDLAPDLDVRIGGWVLPRHTELTLGATWEESFSIGSEEGIPGASTQFNLPLKAGTYLLKFRDSSGGDSPNFASVTIDQVNILQFNSVDTVTEDPAFAGIHDNTVVDSGVLSLDVFGSNAEVEPEGVYYFDTGFDFGAGPGATRLTTHIEGFVELTTDLVDSRSDVDSWTDVDGVSGLGSLGDAWVEERHTNDNPNSSVAVWSEWNRLDSAEFQSRGVEFRLQLRSFDPLYNINVDALSVHAEELAP